MSSQSIDLKNKSALQQPPAEEKFKSVLELLEEDDEFEVLIIISLLPASKNITFKILSVVRNLKELRGKML